MSDEGDDRFALERELQESSEVMNHSNALMELLGEDDEAEDADANTTVVDENSDDSSLKKPGAYSVDQGRTELLQDSSKLGSKGRDELIIQPDENAATEEENGAGLRDSTPNDSTPIDSTPNDPSHIDPEVPAPLPLVTPTVSVVAVRVSPEDEERRVMQRVISQAVRADEVVPEEAAQTSQQTAKNKNKSLWLMGAAFLAILGLLIGLAVGLTWDKGGSSGEDSKATEEEDEKPTFKPTLQMIRERGVLRCGLPDAFYLINYDDNGERVGFEVDLVS